MPQRVDINGRDWAATVLVTTLVGAVAFTLAAARESQQRAATRRNTVGGSG